MKIGGVSVERSVRQHATFLRAVRRAGADVECVPFVHGGHDSIFMKDSAILVKRIDGLHALLCRPRYVERQIEQKSRFHALVDAGFMVHASSGGPLEGGDFVPYRGSAFLGVGFRSKAASCSGLENFLRCPVVPIELVDPRLYHLDMALASLRDGTLVVCKEAISPQSFRKIERMATGAIASVSLRDALRFAINFIEVGDTLLGSPPTSRIAEVTGRDFVPLSLSEFHAAGGGAACLASEVHDASRFALRHNIAA